MAHVVNIVNSTTIRLRSRWPHVYMRYMYNAIILLPFQLDTSLVSWLREILSSYWVIPYYLSKCRTILLLRVKVIWCVTPLSTTFQLYCVPGENRRPVTSHWQTLSHNVVSVPNERPCIFHVASLPWNQCDNYKKLVITFLNYVKLKWPGFIIYTPWSN